MTLPVPRDAREYEAMKATFVYARKGYTSMTADWINQQAVESIPPVGEPPIELRQPWVVVRRRDGMVWHSPFATAELAERQRTRHDSSEPPEALATVRLAVVEVYDPSAPDSWEKALDDALEHIGSLPWSKSNGKVYDALKARRAALLAGKGETGAHS